MVLQPVFATIMQLSKDIIGYNTKYIIVLPIIIFIIKTYVTLEYK